MSKLGWPVSTVKLLSILRVVLFGCLPLIPSLAGSTQINREAVEQLRAMSPAAASAYEKAEPLLAAGKYAGAEPLLARASTMAPQSEVIARAHCRTLTELGRGQPAVDACRRAVVHEVTQKEWPADMLAMVRALLSAKNGPTPEQLFQAISITSSLMRKVPNQPWPYLAECEIASHIGSKNAEHYCDAKFGAWALTNLNYDPMLGLRKSQRLRWTMWGAWLILGVLCVVTLIHALRSKLRAGSRPAVKAAAIALLLILAGWHNVALAQQNRAPTSGDLGTTQINDKDPVSSVPSPAERDRDPLAYAYFIMDITARAERATKYEDYKTAALYLKALVKAVPNKSIGYSKLCAAYEALQDWPNALEVCRAALGYEGVKDSDYAKYAHILMEHKPKLAAEEIADLDAIVLQLRSASPPSPAADLVECEVGVKLHDKTRLQRCTANLAARNPVDAVTLSFQWAYAVERGDYNGAKSLITQLRQTTANASVIKRMEDATALALPLWKRALRWPFALVVVGGLALATLLTIFGRRFVRQPIIAKQCELTGER
jgi:hypothetical protein